MCVIYSIQLHTVHTITLALYSNPRKYSLPILLSQLRAKINIAIICLVRYNILY